MAEPRLKNPAYEAKRERIERAAAVLGLEDPGAIDAARFSQRCRLYAELERVASQAVDAVGADARGRRAAHRLNEALRNLGFARYECIDEIEEFPCDDGVWRYRVRLLRGEGVSPPMDLDTMWDILGFPPLWREFVKACEEDPWPGCGMT